MNETELKRLAQRIVRKMLDHYLLDKKKFRQVWDGTDQKIKEEIRNTMVVDVLVCLGTIEENDDAG